MKTYQIHKYDGNQNKWLDTFTVTGSTNIEPEQAEDFNNRFETTGIKYVESDEVNDKGGMTEQTNPSTLDVVPDTKPDVDITTGENGQDIDVTHSEQKDGTATELDHGTLGVANEDGVAIIDNATTLQDDTNKVENDGQAKSAPAPDAEGDLTAK